MKKLLFGAILLALVIVVPIPTMAQVGISVNIGLPPPIAFPAPTLKLNKATDGMSFHGAKNSVDPAILALPRQLRTHVEQK